jgi:stress response protein YsnF
MELATTDESAGTITVSTDKETAKNGPAFDDDREITPEYENEVRSYYGLGAAQGSGSYGEYEGGTPGAGDDGAPRRPAPVGPGMSIGDTETGEFREHDADDEGVNQSHGDDLADEDELRVQRSRRS